MNNQQKHPVKKILPPPQNPNRRKVWMEKYVQIVGLGLAVFFFLLAIGNMYFLMTPTVVPREVTQVMLIGASVCFLVIGAVLLGIYGE